MPFEELYYEACIILTAVVIAYLILAFFLWICQ